MKLFIVVGTRPEIIRLSQTINLCRKLFDTTLIHTGQNYDINLNDVFFKDLKIYPPDIYLQCSTNNCGDFVGDIIKKTYNLFLEKKPTAILILGDTNSCLCAYSAKRLKIPIFHLEAGNRSFDPNVPEEINRKIIDHLSDINMCYMEHAKTNLLKESIRSEYCFVVGSPIPEIYNNIKNDIESSNILETLNLNKNDYFVWSSHREDNIDNDINFNLMIDSLTNLSKTYNKKIIFGAHPRTMNKFINLEINDPNILITKPFGLLDYYKLLKNCIMVISDSGTISEESNILGIRCVLLRYSTEHPETIDAGSIILGNINWDNLKTSIDVSLKLENKHNTIIDYKDSNFSEKVCKIISGYHSIVNKMIWMK
jgi:UDP-N-acetylglucosamine 2-epimerase (non-hydrolysing)